MAKETKEATGSELYAIMQLARCAEELNKEFLKRKNISPRALGIMRRFGNNCKIMRTDIDFCVRGRGDTQIWEEEKKRDYMAFSATLEAMAEMDDFQREQLENVAKSILGRKVLFQVLKGAGEDNSAIGGKLIMQYMMPIKKPDAK